MWLLAQNDVAPAAGSMLVLLIQLAILVAVLVGAWKVFEKAGKPGWAAIIPIYNAICCWRSWDGRSGGSFCS
jgi:hypothetical protein